MAFLLRSKPQRKPNYLSQKSINLCVDLNTQYFLMTASTIKIIMLSVDLLSEKIQSRKWTIE